MDNSAKPMEVSESNEEDNEGRGGVPGSAASLDL